jgi:hypothetical protein
MPLTSGNLAMYLLKRVVFAINVNVKLTISTLCHQENYWLTAHLAFFNVLLVGVGSIN